MHLPSSQSRATNANIQVLTARSPQGFSPTSRLSHLSDVSDGLSLTREIGTEALYLMTVVITTVGDSLADQGKGKAGLSEPLLPRLPRGHVRAHCQYNFHRLDESGQ